MYVYVFVVNPLADYKVLPQENLPVQDSSGAHVCWFVGRNVVLHMAITGFAFLCVFIHLTILLEYITVA